MKTLLCIQNNKHFQLRKFLFNISYLRKIMLLAFLFATFIKASAQDADAYYRQGYEKEGAEKFKEAIRLFDKAIALKADYVTAWFDRGYCKSSLRLFKEALADYDQALKLDPSYADGWYNRGIAKGNLGDYMGALADLTHAIALEPDDGEIYFDRGYSYEKLGKRDSACADYQKSLDLGFTEAQEDVTGCKNDKLGLSAKYSVFTMDTANGKVNLTITGPVVKPVGRDTTYGITFGILPPQLGNFDSDLEYNEVLNLNPAASMNIELKNGKTVQMKLVLTGDIEAKNKPKLFLGVFNRADRKLLLENGVKKINISSGKATYEYAIKEEYANQIRALLSGSTSH